MFGPRVGFIKFRADVVNEVGGFLPGIVFMRGGAVTMLVILQCEGEDYSIITLQPRVPAGKFLFPELPAGIFIFVSVSPSLVSRFQRTYSF
jgi:ADP-sugar diphosphatase